MELLSRRPEKTTLISVGHRPELEAFHNRKIVLERRRGRKLVSDIKLVSTRRRRFLHRFLNRRSDSRRLNSAVRIRYLSQRRRDRRGRAGTCSLTHRRMIRFDWASSLIAGICDGPIIG